MAWIQLPTDMARNPKTRRLARELCVSVPAAIGHLQMLWSYCMEFAQDGDITRFDDYDLADFSGWEEGNQITAAGFYHTLVQCGFIVITNDNTAAFIDGWDNINPNTSYHAIRKQWNSLRKTLSPIVMSKHGAKCSYCDSIDDLTIDHITPIAKGGKNEIDNLQVLCRSCNCQKGDRL